MRVITCLALCATFFVGTPRALAAPNDKPGLALEITGCEGPSACGLRLSLKRPGTNFKGESLSITSAKDAQQLRITIGGVAPPSGHPVMAMDPPPPEAHVDVAEFKGPLEVVLIDGTTRQSLRLSLDANQLEVAGELSGPIALANGGTFLRVPAQSLSLAATCTDPRAAGKQQALVEELKSSLVTLGAKAIDPPRGRYLSRGLEWQALAPDYKEKGASWTNDIYAYYSYPGDFEKVRELIKAFHKKNPHGPHVFVRGASGGFVNTRMM